MSNNYIPSFRDLVLRHPGLQFPCRAILVLSGGTQHCTLYCYHIEETKLVICPKWESNPRPWRLFLDTLLLLRDVKKEKLREFAQN